MILGPRFIEARHRLRDATRRRDSNERVAIIGRENNGSILRPATSPIIRGVGERDGSPARDGDLFQLPFREEAEPMSVRREEGGSRALRAGEQCWLLAVRTPHEKLRAATVRRCCHESQRGTIGR